MKIFNTIGKYLDQPLLVAKFRKKVPILLSVAGGGFCAYKTKQADKENKKEVFIKNSVILGTTIFSALIAPMITDKLFKKTTLSVGEIKQKNKELIDKFLQTTKTSKETTEILNKAKDKILNYKEVKYLNTKQPQSNEFKNFFREFIPEPENITSKDIFSEIGRLSILGLIPVVGGIFGGIFADKLTNSEWKSNLPNKIKEGAYQYLANIFLCNVGAGMALGIMERLGIKSKTLRALGMIAGIITTGVIGGSAIANLIGNKIINPIFGNKCEKNLYKERTPEAIDIGLHTDDIATVAVMSGLKWIEPALPIMYSISGYRAGIGYRNKKC